MNNTQAKMMLPKWLTWKRFGIYLGIIIVLDLFLIAYMMGIDAMMKYDKVKWTDKEVQIGKTVCSFLIIATFIYLIVWAFLRKRKLKKLMKGEI